MMDQILPGEDSELARRLEASLKRKESRWGHAHKRTDYPETDNTKWLCHVVLKKGVDLDDIQVATKPLIGLDGDEVKV